ncbi:pitrilysin family protein [uncultured Thiothrix sp.]|uniref:M16 family metallopeptidase n=1 Tax=uncultured Thiothrix sp. TaxID=223185 RepID=UPI0026202366|nr:pitrilysin family protein [uncultured Thiothrix sp.]HMT91919.1 pitrilysin family protein [Thiolinea sp.]
MKKTTFKLTYQSLCAAVLSVGMLNAYAVTPIENWQQPNGTSIWLASSMGIPMVDVHIEFDRGKRRDPEGKMGLSSLAASLASKGVLAWKDRPALDEAALGDAWADLGAEFSIGADDDSFAFALRSLTYPDVLPKSIALAAHQIAAPAFDAAIAQREIEKTIAAIKEAETQPAYVAGVAYAQAVFGNHPYGHVTTEASLKALAIDDLKQFYKTKLNPCHAKVSIVGALTHEQADQMVTQLLEGLQVSGQTSCPSLAVLPDPAKLTEAVKKDISFNSAQAQIMIGQPAMKRSDPDFFPILVGNYILGGSGLVSRLSEQVREKQGLTYSIDSYFAARQSVGEFTIALQTRPDQAQQAVDLSIQVLKDFMEQGPSEEELKAAKANLIGGFPLRIDSNRNLLSNIANMARNGLPLNYLDTWTQKVDAVSIEDIRRAFAAKLQMDKMVTVILGAQAAK